MLQAMKGPERASFCILARAALHDDTFCHGQLLKSSTGTVVQH